MAHAVEGTGSNPIGLTGQAKRKEALREKLNIANHIFTKNPDLNGDGKVTQDEVQKFAKYQAQFTLEAKQKELESTQKALEAPIKESKPKFSSEF